MELDVNKIVERIDKEINEIKPYGFRNIDHTIGMKLGLEVAKKIILTGDCGHTR